MLTRNSSQPSGLITQKNCVGNNDIEIVNSFNFLGSIIARDGNCSNEVRRRIGCGKSSMKRLSRVWRDRDIQLSTEIQLVKTFVFPVMLYRAESWTLTLDSRRKLQAAELWCWRRLLRIPWTSHTSNEEVLLRIGSAAATPLDDIIFHLKLRYFGHIVRRAESLEKELMLAMAERAPGREEDPGVDGWTRSRLPRV